MSQPRVRPSLWRGWRHQQAWFARRQWWPWRDVAGAALVVVFWAFVVFPLATQVITTQEVVREVGAETASNPIQSLVYRLTFLLVLGVGGVAVLLRITHLFDAGFGRVFVLMSPWLYMLLRDLYNGVLNSQALLYPFLVLAVAALRPHPRVLKILAWLTALTAAISIVIGLAIPDAGILHEEDGSVVKRTDKAVFPSLGLLNGVFTSENNLAQFLALGFPFIVLVRGLWWRLLYSAFMVFAVLWSSSRGGMISLFSVIVVWVVLSMLRSIEVRALAARFGVALTAGVLVVMPFLGWSDDDWTDRGGIWRASLLAWEKDGMVFGLGSDWYTRVGKTTTSPIIQAAYHAHNQTVHVLVTGGLVYAALVAVFFFMISRELLSVTSPFIVMSAMMLVSLFLSGLFEVPFGVVDRVTFWPVTILPLSIMLLRDKRSDPDEVRLIQHTLRQRKLT